jgi:hypothetical protein
MAKEQTMQWPKEQTIQWPKNRLYNDQRTDYTMAKEQTIQWPKEKVTVPRM